ncbi:MBL fold metallo-hydrolase [Litorilinea aerophila]|uniref:MBL fold metallo-hydrolase n=1 Tax=Litorilinea aerophila TaxID=1204385 RepID=A0A540VCL2_9CHLR|nr:MBL fold metallo-hydrolase [Litorilinea aerophila]MCC9077692.1 MBL fold metallo-hydrolase [Litorilinea aerophila]OUC05506.1 metallo-beta-lactamase [Litorilinea aerophila]GIV77026.1 MAG: MBL fold hydrolase [Litorilinea sp.]
MQITIHGAAQEVTGSLHLLEVNGHRILLECGLFQGRRADTYQRNLNFPFDPASIDTLILSHAHIDHSGNIPNLVKQGFRGNIWCTAATRNLSTYMLLDSGHIQEQDVLYLNKRRARRGEPPVEPIYTRQDAQRCLDQFIGVGLHRPVIVADGVELTFHNAGHILGAAHVALDIREHQTGKRWRLVFSGDIGRAESAILNPPELLKEADILIMESTYGDRLHDSYESARKKLRRVVNDTARRQGKVIIPAFAVGRTQEIVYALNYLDAQGEIPELPIFVDSPLAVNATDVFRMHPEAWNPTVQEFLVEDQRRSPFDFHGLEYVRDVRRSKQLNNLVGPAIIISASGMAESGRILHHLKNNIEYPQNTILLVSFMAQHTLGRRLKDGHKRVRIFGEEYEVRARVESIDGYSAHADQAGLLRWAGSFDRQRLQEILVVHGEPEAANTLAEHLRAEHSAQVHVPSRGQTFQF